MPVVLQVNIWVPQPEKQLDLIKVTGLVANVERAKLGLLERVKELQAEQEDRVRNMDTTVGNLPGPLVLVNVLVSMKSAKGFSLGKLVRIEYNRLL